MKKFILTRIICFLLLPTALSAQVVVHVGPPPVVIEHPGPPPGPHYVWVAGYHSWTGARYVWVPGHYVVPPRPAAVWVPGHWVSSRGGWVFVAGHWR